MAEEKVLGVIEKMDNFLKKKNDTEDSMTIKEKVEKVRNELRSILDLAEGKNLEEGSSLKYWIYDSVEIANNACFVIHDNNKLGYYETLTGLETIRRALGEIRKHILQLGDEGANMSPITFLPPHEGGDEYVVGLEEDVESVLHEWILGKRKGLSAMCIVGMAGVGKTSLAREVYTHPNTVDRFERRVWVSFSGEQSNKEMLMKLTLQVLHNKDQSVLLEEMENADNESLQRMLLQHLNRKNFLIVLDNVGKMPYSKSIFNALRNEAHKQRRLLLTSRFQSIDNCVRAYANVAIVKMKPLNDDRSWQLFLKLLLLGNQQFPKQLAKKGKEMLRRCDGLPLSIKEVATQFVMKRQSGNEWEKLLNSIDLRATLAVLASIYHKWPPQLKSCFLCLSFFEKGTPIRREKLVQVWTAGQVIPHKEEEDQDFEEVEFYLDFLGGYKTTLMKLVDESIIEVNLNKSSLIKCIRVNGSFHTLSMVKAEEEMVFETLKKGEANPLSSKEPRHRAIYCSRDQFSHFMNHDERLVSLFFRGGGYFDDSEPYWKRFEQLRTLDFEGFGLKILPEAIGLLTELRYLGLRDNYMQELPQSLACLKNLEVLDIAQNFTMEVSDVVWEIDSLRHLYLSDTIWWKPLKTHTLENLETLTYISVDNWTNECPRWKLINLCKLGIDEVDQNSDVGGLLASLQDLSNLDFLILRGSRFRSLPQLHGLQELCQLSEITLNGLITKLPSADIFPLLISHLSLINSCLDEDPLPKLGKLENLSYLKLKNAYTGQQMVIPSKSFPSLKVLCIEELWHLRYIHAGNNTLVLVELVIKSCPCLENISRNIITRELKMLTSRKLAAKIRKSDLISKIEHVDVQP